MILNKIKCSKDLKKLSYKDKILLSQELREYILNVVSKNGGHLASNLGVVELTIALESIFDLSKDKIVWDVGHQCYVHKILNGRYNEFKSIRKFNGISGFPKTSESFTDCFNTGHSSTSISAAMGLAASRDLNNKNYNVIAVIGDGALTGGMAMEALNHAGSSKTKILVILNDNEMSISKNIGGINNLLTRLRSKKNYSKSNDFFKNFILKAPYLGNKFVSCVGKFKSSIKQFVIPKMYFEEIGFRYLGPVDGHDLLAMEDLFRKAKDLDGPTLIHVLTKKGKGYSFAEENPDKFHGVGSFDIFTGEMLSKSSQSFSSVFGNKLVSLAKKNKKIVAITAAMKDGTGLSEFAAKFPNRFFDVGIAEQHALTFAAGLAMNGQIPFVSIYSSFYQRGIDQIIHDICLQNLPVIMCVDRAGAVGSDGDTHQGLYDMSLFKCIPNIIIMSPKNFIELESMMEFAITLNRPVAIRYPRGSESKIKMSCSPIKFCKAELLSSGNDLTIILIGNSVAKGIELANLLKNNNIYSDVINCRFLKPIDEKLIVKSIKKTGNVIVIEDGSIIGGLSSSVKEIIADNNLTNVNSSFYAYPDQFVRHGTVSELEKYYKIDVNYIYKQIKKSKTFKDKFSK